MIRLSLVSRVCEASLRSLVFVCVRKKVCLHLLFWSVLGLSLKTNEPISEMIWLELFLPKYGNWLVNFNFMLLYFNLYCPTMRPFASKGVGQWFPTWGP